MLRGDTNSKFFQQFANGSRRKNLIKNLETDNGVIQSQEDIEKHVTSFYKMLFGSSSSAGLKLSERF